MTNVMSGGGKLTTFFTFQVLTRGAVVQCCASAKNALKFKKRVVQNRKFSKMCGAMWYKNHTIFFCHKIFSQKICSTIRQKFDRKYCHANYLNFNAGTLILAVLEKKFHVVYLISSHIHYTFHLTSCDIQTTKKFEKKIFIYIIWLDIRQRNTKYKPRQRKLRHFLIL